MDCFIGCLVVHDGKVQFAGQHKLVQLRGVVFLKLHGDVRVELLKGRKYPGKQVSSEVHGNAEGELSAAHLTVFVQIGLQAFAAVEDLSCGI